MGPPISHLAVAPSCKEDVEVSKSYVLMVRFNIRSIPHGVADRDARAFYHHMLHITDVVQY